MLRFYCYFGGGSSGSGVMSMILSAYFSVSVLCTCELLVPVLVIMKKWVTKLEVRCGVHQV